MPIKPWPKRLDHYNQPLSCLAVLYPTANYTLIEEDLESERLLKFLHPFKDKLFALTIAPYRHVARALHILYPSRCPGA
jgi:hypothetical protein